MIAIISDIHGNLPALQAVIEDIEKRNVSRIICLGDIIGKGPNSAEAVDICRDICDEIVLGNWDKYIANTEKSDESIDYYKGQLGPARLEYLRGLPEFTEFYLSGKLVRLFHAHPLDVFKRVFIESDKAEKVGMFVQPELVGKGAISGPSDIVGYGDIHWAYSQNLRSGILFNAGSVGNPLDMTMATYAILAGELDSKAPGAFSIQLCRVPYDIELAVSQAEAGKVPEIEAFVKELRTAIYSRRR